MIKIGKDMKKIIDTIEDTILSMESVMNLISIIDSDDIIPGCATLNSLCLYLANKKNQFILNLVINMLVYLMEIKADKNDVKTIAQYLNYHQEIFSKDIKQKLINSYYILCNRYKIETDPILLNNFLNLEENEKKIIENKENSEEKQKLKNKRDENQKDIQQNQIGNSNKTKKYQKKNENSAKNNPKEEIAKNDREESKEKKNDIRNIDQQKNVEESKEKKNDNAKQQYKVAQKEKNKEIPQKSLDRQIEEIIDEAWYLFENKQNIERNEYYDEIMKLDLKDNESIFFHKIDEIMARYKPTKENAAFWKIMMRIFDKIPALSKHEIDALRDKLKALKGFVRDNKEKASRIKENKEIYKEELKKQGKFEKGFKNGDREQKRSQKPQIISENEKKMNMDYDALNKSILKLSQDSLNLVREHSLDMSSLCIINDHIISIKKTLQLLSKSISIKVIGSANIGTCLKQSEIDLLFLDKLNQGKEILLKSFPKIVQISEKIFVIMTPDEKYRFKIFTEANFEVEISNLMKKYCLIDTRINELIIFVKLWARENSLAFVSGFH